MVDEELQKVRDRLSRINDKIKQYSTLTTGTQVDCGQELTPSQYKAAKALSVEEMHAKLQAINQYVRDKAAGLNVPPPPRFFAELPKGERSELAATLRPQTGRSELPKGERSGSFKSSRMSLSERVAAARAAFARPVPRAVTPSVPLKRPELIIVKEEVPEIGANEEGRMEEKPEEAATFSLPDNAVVSSDHVVVLPDNAVSTSDHVVALPQVKTPPPPPSSPPVDVRLGVGLDLGTAYLVAGREVEDKRVFVKNERNAFLSVRCDTSTKELLTRLKVKYVALGDKLYVLGTMALELADIFGRETQRTMNMGIMNPSEAESIPIVKLLAQNIMWPARVEGEVCCFSVPAKPIDRDQDTIYHRGVFEGILKSIGFSPLVIDEGYAVVLAEMEDSDFTGIGVSCGAGMVNICAAFKSVPVQSFSITRGGDWIDKSAATVLGVTMSRVCSIKEHGLSLLTPKTREEEAIVIYYRNYIHYLVESMAQVFGRNTGTPRFKDPVNIVFAGGSSMVPGFLEVVREEVKAVRFGFEVGQVIHAKEPFTSVVRGCLFNAIEAGRK